MDTEKQPLISVVIPVYQVKKYLKRCLKSVVSQTYQNFEIILVDDGSTDGSGQICDEFLDKFKERFRIRVFHTENHGLAAARNYGLKYAEGSLVTFVDSDDALRKEYLEMMEGVMEKYGVRLVQASFTSDEAEYQKGLDSGSADVELFERREAFRKYVTDSGITGYAWGKLYDIALFDGIRYPENISHGQDSFTTFKFVLRAEKMAVLRNQLYFYYRHPDTLTGSFSPTRIRLKAVPEAMRDFVKSEGLEEIPDIMQMIDSFEVQMDFMILNYYIGHGQDGAFAGGLAEIRQEILNADFTNPYIKKKYRQMRILLKIHYRVFWLFSKVSQKIIRNAYW